MNILVFGQAAWDDKNSAGNTFSNFFSGTAFSGDSFSNFYCREKCPDNKLNITYYNLSASNIIKGILKLKVKGKEFISAEAEREFQKCSADSKSEQDKINNLHKGKFEFVYFIHEIVWMSKIWLNRYFKAFVNRNKPDILFAFATSPYILWPLMKFLKKHTNCKVVLLIADDVYGSYDRVAWFRRGYLKKLLSKCIVNADQLYGISDEMSDLYKCIFKKNVTTLYKGCDLSEEPKRYVNDTVKFVYAGNLFWGRDDILSLLGKTIDKINKNGTKAELEIYTAANITPEIERKLNIQGSSSIMGARSYDEIKKIMHDADVVVHVESFDEQQMKTTQYSLSTKIIDCLQSGSQIVGIGPSGIASIEYLKRINGVIVVDNKEKIEAAISSIVEDKNSIIENSKKIRQYSETNHEISIVQKKLRDDFALLCSR